MKPGRELYLSFFSCSFFSAQSLFVSMALVYSRSTHNFSSMSKARPSGLRSINVSISVSSKSMAQAVRPIVVQYGYVFVLMNKNNFRPQQFCVAFVDPS